MLILIIVYPQNNAASANRLIVVGLMNLRYFILSIHFT